MRLPPALHRSSERLRQLLRRGPLHAWWLARQARRWERAVNRQFVLSAQEPRHPPTPRAFSASRHLKTLLYVGDCMWEQGQLLPELRKICNVEVLDLRPGLRSRPASQTEPEAVVESARTFTKASSHLEPELILFYARPNLMSEEVFDLLRRRWSCPLFGMSMDDKMEFFPYGIFHVGSGENYEHWARRFDLNLTNCLPATDWYRQRGLPCLYVPNGFHQPEGLQPPSTADFKYELSFLGSQKPERAAVINQLLAAGIPIHLFGSGWPNSQWVDDPTATFRATQLNLGIGLASPSLRLTTLKGRDFECPGVGACYLTTYSWELANLYEVGKEILCYQSVEELIEMFSWYRQRPQDCLQIAQAAWRRCEQEHTWEKRFRKALQQAGFKLQ